MKNNIYKMVNSKEDIHTPLLSVITIVFNGEKYLEQTIVSVAQQTYTNIEYIIIDGGSTDKTKDIIRQYESDITLWISEKDNGIYDAMNKGLELLTGDFVWYINAGDEIYDKNTVENIFLNYNGEDAFYGTQQLINEDGSNASVTKVPGQLTWKNLMHGMAVSHQSIILSIHSVDKYNLEYKIVSDQDWVISALKKCKKIKNTNQIMSKYLLGGFSDQNFYKGWKEKFYITFKQYGIFALLLNYVYFIRAFIKKIIRHYLYNSLKGGK